MTLDTPRLALRPFEPGDLGGLHAIFGDPRVMAFTEPAYSPEQTEAFLHSFCIERRPPGAFACVRRADGFLAGYVLCKEYPDPGVYELGWIFNRACWRQGYAYEICSALIEHLFARQGAHKVWAEAVDTGRSVPLMVKLGLRREGIQRQHTRLHSDGQWHDLHVYGLLREAWAAAGR